MSIKISVVRPFAVLDRSWNYLQQAGAAQVGPQASAGAAQEASTGAQQVGSGAQQEDL